MSKSNILTMMIPSWENRKRKEHCLKRPKPTNGKIEPSRNWLKLRAQKPLQRPKESLQRPKKISTSPSNSSEKTNKDKNTKIRWRLFSKRMHLTLKRRQFRNLGCINKLNKSLQMMTLQLQVKLRRWKDSSRSPMSTRSSSKRKLMRLERMLKTRAYKLN